LKIASYNVNSIRSRMHIVVPWLKNNTPDYFCMQETKVADSDFPASEFQSLGYHVLFKGERQYKGVAIVSKRKPEKVMYGFDHEPIDADRLITVTYDDLTIINSYVPQGQSMDSPQFAYKLEWFARMKNFYKNILILNGISCGAVISMSLRSPLMFMIQKDCWAMSVSIPLFGKLMRKQKAGGSSMYLENITPGWPVTTRFLITVSRTLFNVN